VLGVGIVLAATVVIQLPEGPGVAAPG